MKDRSVVAQRLKEARLRAGISQKRLGILAGIDEFSASARINQYERGKHTPEFSTSERLARVLDVPTPFLYCRDDDLAKRILAYFALDKRQRQRASKRVKRRPDRM